MWIFVTKSTNGADKEGDRLEIMVEKLMRRMGGLDKENKMEGFLKV